MQRPAIWLMLVVLLLGVLFVREPRLEQSEEFFLQWLLKTRSRRGRWRRSLLWRLAMMQSWIEIH